MNPYLQYYFMIPFAGFLANAALLLLVFSNKSEKKYFWPFVMLYFGVAGWNLDVMFLFLVKNADQAKITVYVAFHAIPLIGLGFLWIALYLSGRTATHAARFAVLWTALIILIAEYSFWFTKDNTLFISGVRRFNWGHYPEIGLGTKIFSVQSLFCVIVGFYYFTRPVKPAPLMSKFRNIFICFWLGALTSYLRVFGIEIFPIGNATDAIISVFAAQTLFETENLKPSSRKFLQWAAGLAAIAVALIFSWIISEFLLNIGKGLSVVLTISSAAVAVWYFQRFFRIANYGDRGQAAADSLFTLLQREYGLTFQEATICNLLANGAARQTIARQTQISPNTLKVHLSSIYRKTIDHRSLLPTVSKDKLQRLTVFLHEVDKKNRRTNT